MRTPPIVIGKMQFQRTLVIGLKIVPALHSEACALEGTCDAADVRDYILFYGLTPATSQLAIQYQARLMDVIRAGDWSYFTIVRGPGPNIAPFVRR